jgi:hypothetical protein
MADGERSNMRRDDVEGKPVPEAPAVGDAHERQVSFLDVVTFEQRRSQRHNHYFVVAFLSGKQLALRELARTAARSLRASDMIGPVGMDGRFHWDCPFDGRGVLESVWPAWAEQGVLGVILPETDRPGADAALRRVTTQIGGGQAVSVRYAVYPDSSTDPAELLAIASASPAAWADRGRSNGGPQ